MQRQAVIAQAARYFLAAATCAVPVSALAQSPADVPEPGTMALLALAVGGIGIYRVCRRSK